MDQSDFDKIFTQSFEEQGQKILQTYQNTLQLYRNYIIPFETARMKENQSLSFKSTQLQRQKLSLMKKLQELSAQSHRQNYVMQNQTDKIEDLQTQVQNLDRMNNDNLNVIEALKITTIELQASVDQKINMQKQVSEDKKQVQKDYNSRNAQFQALLTNYLRDKNTVVQKLNYMNQMQNNLKQKQRRIQQQQFYLKKQKQRLEEARKQLLSNENNTTDTSKLVKKSSSRKQKDDDEDEPQPTNQKNKYERIQILKNPMKKITKHHNNEIYDISFNYNGNVVATCGGDRTIKFYDVLNYKSGATIQSHSVDSLYLSLSLDYSGQKLLAGSNDRSVQVFSTSTGKQLHSFVGHGYKVNSVSWTSSKQKCISGSQDKQIKIWQIEKASNILSIPCGKPVKFVSCNSIEPVIYSGHSDGSVRLYSLNQNSTPIAQVNNITDYPVNSIVVLSNRNQVLVSTQQGSPIYLIDLKMNKLLHKYQGKQYSNGNARAEISPSEKYVVAGNSDGSIYYWNKDTQIFEKKVNGHECAVTTMKYHFLSSILATCDREGNLIIWQ